MCDYIMAKGDRQSQKKLPIVHQENAYHPSECIGNMDSVIYSHWRLYQVPPLGADKMHGSQCEHVSQCESHPAHTNMQPLLLTAFS
jgi:hypothetical protein